MIDAAATRPRQKPGVVARTLGSETMLYDPESRKVHVLNGTSLAIWELCSGEHTLLAMEAEVRKRFSAAEGDDVLADIADCVTTLQKEGLLLLEPR
jgi:hypothetical protein